LTDGLSVLIPTYNPDTEEIRKLLTALINQSYHNCEIIIANDGVDFYSKISDIITSSQRLIKYKTNPRRLGLYSSIEENLKYCEFDDVLVIEQDVIPLTSDYIESLLSLHNQNASDVVTSRLLISERADYKKFVFYKRRIPNLGIISEKNGNSVFNFSNEPTEVETAFTKADLLNKELLSELYSTKSLDTYTSQDIILSSLIRKNRKLITNDSTACEIAATDPAKVRFFLRKEFLYGKSVVNVLEHSNSRGLASTAYFREKLFRLLFIGVETILVLISLIPFFGVSVRAIALTALVIIGMIYTQSTLFKIDFWRFSRSRMHRFVQALKASIYIIALDSAYVVGVVAAVFVRLKMMMSRRSSVSG
jgi:glycosyltransferase involved in cell wall biosynthesis